MSARSRWTTPTVSTAGVLAPVALVAAAVGAGSVAVLAPVAVLVAVAAIALLALMVHRVELIAACYVVLEPFGDLVRAIDPDAIKAVGAILFAAWLLRLVREPRTRGLRHPAVYAVGALVALVIASFAMHGADLGTGGDHLTSYAAYALVLVVLVDTICRGRPTPSAVGGLITTAFVCSCTAAGLVALVVFLHHGGRADGPMSDPNDLAFFLLAALPFALVRARRASGLAGFFALCAAVLVVAVFATLSRGAIVGLVAMVVVALALGSVRIGTALAVGAIAAIAIALLWSTHAGVVSTSIAEKSHVATQNVESRLTTWQIAADMTATDPLLGQGPGGFASKAQRFAPADAPVVRQTVAHQMYLDVSAEVGLPALAAFLAAVGYALRGALRARRTPSARPLAEAVVIALAGTLTAACFLSEQFYLPIWMLIALGVALEVSNGAGTQAAPGRVGVA